MAYEIAVAPFLF